MYIKKEMNFTDLFNNSWSGAIDTLKAIEEADKEEELMEYLEVVFEGDVPDETEVNDFLWFESDDIYEYLGIFQIMKKKRRSKQKW